LSSCLRFIYSTTKFAEILCKLWMELMRPFQKT
jgi:hypothetical protein